MKIVRNVIHGIAVSAFTISAGAIQVFENFEEITFNLAVEPTPYSNQGVTFTNFVGVNSADVSTGFASIDGLNHDGVRAIATRLVESGDAPITTVTFDPTFTSEFSFIYASNQSMFFTANYIDAGSIARSFSATLDATFIANAVPSLGGCGQANGGNGDQIFCSWKEVTSAGFNIPSTGSLTSLTFSHNLSADTPPAAMLDRFAFNTTAANPVPAAIPEPSTYALMVLGLLGIGFVARRRIT